MREGLVMDIQGYIDEVPLRAGEMFLLSAAAPGGGIVATAAAGHR